MFLLSADKTKLAVLKKETITSGSVGVYDVRFQFNSDWDDMERYAVFRVGSERVSILLDEENTCTIPWECLRENDVGDNLYAGVYGMIGETTVLPTIWVLLGNISEGTKLGNSALPPTPSLVEQVLAQVLAARDEAIAARDAAILAAGGTIPDTDDGTEDDGTEDSGGTEDGGDDNTGTEDSGSDSSGDTETEETPTDENTATDEEVNDMFEDIFGT